MVDKLIKRYEKLMSSSDSKLKKKYMALMLSTLIGAGYFVGSITHASALTDEEKQDALKNTKSTQYEQIEENYNPYNNDNYDIIVMFEIEPGDSLDEIAKEYNVTVEDLMEINNYKTLDDFKPGNTIVVGSVKNKEIVDYDKEKQKLEKQKDELQAQKEMISSNRLSWEDAMDANGGYAYVIDVSSSNVVDLDKILKNNPNIVGVMIRTSYEWNGKSLDSEMDKYVKACVDNNCDFGFYCWPTFRNITETEKQLNNVFSNIDNVCEKYNTMPTLPLAFDIEKDEFNRDLTYRVNQQKDEATIESIEYGLEMVKENGYYPMIYSGLRCVCDSQGNALPLGKIIEENNVDSWIARYASNNTLKIGDEKLIDLKYPGKVEMYQFTGHGVINGTKDIVDISACNVNYPEIIANYNKSR